MQISERQSAAAVGVFADPRDRITHGPALSFRPTTYTESRMSEVRVRQSEPRGVTPVRDR
jgi:hypothetical protein